MWKAITGFFGSLFEDGFTDPIDKTIAVIPVLGKWLTGTAGRKRSLGIFAEVVGSKVALKGLKTVIGFLTKDAFWQQLICAVAGGTSMVVSPTLSNRYGQEAAMLGTMAMIDVYMRKVYGTQGATEFWWAVSQGTKSAEDWLKKMMFKYGRHLGLYKTQDYITTPHITPRYTPPGIVSEAKDYLKQLAGLGSIGGYGAQAAGSEGLSGVQKPGGSGGALGWAVRHYAPQQVSVEKSMGALLNP